MIKLIQILSEIRIIPYKKLVATRAHPNQPNSKAYRVNMGTEEFTIHKFSNFSSLYPSFNPKSGKYQRIVKFMESKGIKFKEIRNQPHTVFFRIDNKHIQFEEDNINEIQIMGKLKNDNDLLKFLEANKDTVISILENNERISPNYDEEWEEEWKVKFDSIRNSKFEMDSMDCPSIGDGINYYSFSLDLSKVNDDNLDQEMKIGNKKFYYTSYSI